MRHKNSDVKPKVGDTPHRSYTVCALLSMRQYQVAALMSLEYRPLRMESPETSAEEDCSGDFN